ncbi:MAG: hypothetical protein PHC66_02890 [Candidatus Nanoarchaeia archaeon]|nr:hypothetical protein [Candidatus Nanoarchaeia archaeon]MDD5239008.1 hypothetical protein [Candidatus Nanoarchaeia archaeon]
MYITYKTDKIVQKEKLENVLQDLTKFAKQEHDVDLDLNCRVIPSDVVNELAGECQSYTSYYNPPSTNKEKIKDILLLPLSVINDILILGSSHSEFHPVFGSTRLLYNILQSYDSFWVADDCAKKPKSFASAVAYEVGCIIAKRSLDMDYDRDIRDFAEGFEKKFIKNAGVLKKQRVVSAST